MVKKLPLCRELVGIDGVSVNGQRGANVAVAKHRGDGLDIHPVPYGVSPWEAH